ncbi:MAG: hypothetical protein AUH72_00330 [Acidobacteria bacterium 13_1_40CM_4_65_8]|nr:MAG: hypothetical protein AUH72_00330 [Acidobacteria bacterium 13_1_40CM_4_65_8]
MGVGISIEATPMLMSQYSARGEAQEQSMRGFPATPCQPHSLGRVNRAVFNYMLNDLPLFGSQGQIDFWTQNYASRLNPRASLTNVVSQRDANDRMVLRLLSELWRRQFGLAHQPQHSSRSFRSAFDDVHEQKRVHEKGVPRGMVTVNVLGCDARWERTRAENFETIVEHLDEDRNVLECAP